MIQNVTTYTEITKAILWVIIAFVTLLWNLGNESKILVLNLKPMPPHSAFITNYKHPYFQDKKLCPKFYLILVRDSREMFAFGNLKRKKTLKIFEEIRYLNLNVIPEFLA